MNYWFLKSEPETYSIDDLIKDKKTVWDGVRNYSARNNLRAMKKGDQAIFYHSGEDKVAVGLAEITHEAYQDPKTSEDWSAVDIAPISKFKNPVTLSTMKADGVLKNMIMVRQSRLSVSPLTTEEFKKLLALSK